MTDALNPETTFVHLEAEGRAEPIPVSPAFWEEMMTGKRVLDGWLVTRGRTTKNWDQWEQHPEGE